MIRGKLYVPAGEEVRPRTLPFSTAHPMEEVLDMARMAAESAGAPLRVYETMDEWDGLEWVLRRGDMTLEEELACLYDLDRTFSTLGDVDKNKLLGAINTGAAETLQEVSRLHEHLDEYELIPMRNDVETLGRFLVRQGVVNIHQPYHKYLDYEAVVDNYHANSREYGICPDGYVRHSPVPAIIHTGARTVTMTSPVTVHDVGGDDQPHKVAGTELDLYMEQLQESMAHRRSMLGPQGLMARATAQLTGAYTTVLQDMKATDEEVQNIGAVLSATPHFVRCGEDLACETACTLGAYFDDKAMSALATYLETQYHYNYHIPPVPQGSAKLHVTLYTPGMADDMLRSLENAPGFRHTM